MSNTLLVSGFERFGARVRGNPSSEVALPALEVAYGDTVHTVTLPVAYDEAAQKLQEHIDETQPAAILMFGATGYFGRHVTIETRGTNYRSNLGSLLPDNNFAFRHGKIAQDGEPILHATLPTECIKERLEQEGIKARVSTHAGRFVCNDLLYQTLNRPTQRDKSVPTGFIHINRGMTKSDVERAAVGIASETLKNLPRLP